MPSRPRWRPAAATVAVALTLSACLGATPRDEFEEIIRARGGGVTTDLFADGIDALEERLDTAGLVVRSLTADPETASLSVEVRDPVRPANLDRWSVVGGSVQGEPTPVLLSSRDDLDRQTFAIDLVALDRIEAMADASLEAFGAQDAWVDSITVTLGGTEAPLILLSLNSPRARASATFTADGDLVEVVRL